jgi:TolA-binding protein
MTAAQVAGFDMEQDSGANHPLRQALRDHLAKLPLNTRNELRSFYLQHRQGDLTSDFNSFISYSLTLGAPPDFNYVHTGRDLPPDAASLEGFNKLVAKFWAEAKLDAIWKQIQPAYEQAIEQYHEPVTRAVTQANAYLRNPTSGSPGRVFQIIVELNAPPNQIQTRSYGDDFFVLVTPTPELPVDEIRHAYMQYLLDPLSIRFKAALAKKVALLEFAQPAPALPDYYKSDFSLLTTKSLVKAIEARLAPAAKREEMIQQAMREGYILTAGLFEGLPAYEKQETAMRLYYPQLIDAIDLRKEDRRLASIEFVQQRAARVVRVTPAERKVELTGPAKTLDQAEQKYNEKQYPQAKELFLQLLRDSDQSAFQAKAYFGLARIAALDRDPETSDRLFRKTLELQPEADIQAWSLLYLGRLADAQGNRDEARQHYEAVLKVTGAPPKVKAAAEQGIKEAFKKE